MDKQAASNLGIQVFRTAWVLNQAVAELTLGLILSALRAIPLQDRQIRDGVWQKRMGRLLQGKVVGVIGFGSIGQCVGKLITAFDVTVLYYDPVSTNVAWSKAVSIHNQLAQSDIVTIHADAQEQIFGEKELLLIHIHYYPINHGDYQSCIQYPTVNPISPLKRSKQLLLSVIQII